jgi:flagellar protein FlaG
MDQPTVNIGPVNPVADSVPVRRTPTRLVQADQKESAAEATGSEKDAGEKAVQKAVRTELAHQVDARLQIEIDPDLHRPVVKVVDTQSGKVIRQIPAEEMLAIAKHLNQVEGLLFKETV